MSGGRDRPAGARADLSAVPAGYQGDDARAKWKAALAAHNAALRRGRFTRAAKKTGPGMIRKPPQTPGDAGRDTDPRTQSTPQLRLPAVPRADPDRPADQRRQHSRLGPRPLPDQPPPDSAA